MNEIQPPYGNDISGVTPEITIPEPKIEQRIGDLELEVADLKMKLDAAEIIIKALQGLAKADDGR